MTNYFYHCCCFYYYYWANTHIVPSMEGIGILCFLGVLLFKIWTKRGVMKKLLRNRELVEMGVLLENKGRGIPNFFISFPSEKHVFITIGILFFGLFWTGKYSRLLLIKRSIFSCCLLSTWKWYIMKFLFVLLLFLNKILKILLLIYISISISLKTSNILENKSQVFERSDCTITAHNDLCHNELVI